MQVLTSRARDCGEGSTFVTLRHTTHALVRPDACGRRLRRHRTGEVSATEYRVLRVLSRGSAWWDVALRGTCCVRVCIRDTCCVRVCMRTVADAVARAVCQYTLSVTSRWCAAQVSGARCSARYTLWSMWRACSTCGTRRHP